MTLRIATRTSQLARLQTELVIRKMRQIQPDLDVEIVTFTTTGDRTAGPLSRVGGKGLFTAELEEALLTGRVDLAVHSAKDMPAEMPEHLEIAATPPRADARDAIVLAEGLAWPDLPGELKIGTSSPRRAVMIVREYPDVRVAPIRGNVETRLSHVLPSPGDLDAVILAMAGLERTGLLRKYTGRIVALDPRRFIPAAGQGTLVVQSRTRAELPAELCALLQGLTDDTTETCLHAERSVIRGLGAGCSSPVAVFVSPPVESDETWTARGFVGCRRTGRCIQQVCSEPEADLAANRLLERLLQGGAKRLLRHGSD